MSIKIGDRVNVYWDNIDAEINVRVIHLPYSAGDSWRLERLDNTIVYVQIFGKMVKL